MEKPFDWKKSGVYAWKAAFPLAERSEARLTPAAPPPAAKNAPLFPPKPKKG
jgi:hypothetical protein